MSTTSPREVGVRLAKELTRTARRAADSEPRVNPERSIVAAAAELARVTRLTSAATVEAPWPLPPDEPSQAYGVALARQLVEYVSSTFTPEEAARVTLGAATYMSKKVELYMAPPFEDRRDARDVN